MTRRHPDWRARLNAFLAANELRAFSWEEQWDCCFGLMAGALIAVRGEERDPRPPYQGRYTTERGAIRALKRVDGVSSPTELMTKWFGEQRPSAFARTGDLVLYAGCIGVMSGGEGVFIGTEMLGADRARDGLVRIPRAELEGCWHV
jgi:hypothetical protein